MFLVHSANLDLTQYHYSHRSYTPWVDDHDCEKFRVAFSNQKSLHLIGLASFPRSGNTSIRYLIEGATGVFTGSFYNSRCMVSQGKISNFV